MPRQVPLHYPTLPKVQGTPPRCDATTALEVLTNPPASRASPRVSTTTGSSSPGSSLFLIPYYDFSPPSPPNGTRTLCPSPAFEQALTCTCTCICILHNPLATCTGKKNNNTLSASSAPARLVPLSNLRSSTFSPLSSSPVNTFSPPISPTLTPRGRDTEYTIRYWTTYNRARPTRRMHAVERQTHIHISTVDHGIHIHIQIHIPLAAALGLGKRGNTAPP